MKPLSERDENFYDGEIKPVDRYVGMKPLSERDENIYQYLS